MWTKRWRVTTRGLRSRPGDALGLADKGLLLSEIGRVDEAASLLRDAIAARPPKRVRLFYNLAQTEKLPLDDAAVVAQTQAQRAAGRGRPDFAALRIGQGF